MRQCQKQAVKQTRIVSHITSYPVPSY